MGGSHIGSHDKMYNTCKAYALSCIVCTCIVYDGPRDRPKIDPYIATYICVGGEWVVEHSSMEDKGMAGVGLQGIIYHL